MALNVLGDSIVSEVRTLFSQPRGSSQAAAGSKKKKKARTQDEPSPSLEFESEAESSAVFTEDQAAWLGETMSSVSQVLARAVSTQIARVEKRLDGNERATRQALDAAGSAAEAAEALSARAGKAEERMTAFEAELKALREQGEAQAKELAAARLRAVASPARPTRNGAVADAAVSEPRTAARIGNLGWDTPDTELVERATTLLTKASVPEGSWQALCAACRPGGTGSMCDLQFTDERSLLVAKGLIRNANMTFGDAPRAAWLDIKKTQALTTCRRAQPGCIEWSVPAAAWFGIRGNGSLRSGKKAKRTQINSTAAGCATRSACT